MLKIFEDAAGHMDSVKPSLSKHLKLRVPTGGLLRGSCLSIPASIQKERLSSATELEAGLRA